MASIPEKLPNNPTFSPSEDKIHKICGDYLRYALQQTKPKDEIAADFEILDGFISIVKKIKIPDGLSEEFRLQKLKWMRFSHKDALSILFVGKKTNAETANNNYEDALATIEIGQVKQFDKSINNWKDIPACIRIAGIMQDRVVAATWALPDGNITDLNVSISNDEFNERHPLDYKKMVSLHLKAMAPLPTSLSNPYLTAAFITEEMYKNTGHDNALAFQINPKEIVYKGFASSNPEDIIRLAIDLGYYAKRENGMVIIGLGGFAPKERNINTWEIGVAASLEKA
jgi:hypothetical protein